MAIFRESLWNPEYAELLDFVGTLETPTLHDTPQDLVLGKGISRVGFY